MAKTVIPRFTLVAPSADGTCCPCSALSDPCTCAGLIPIVRCRTRSALAALIGFPEIVDPQDPPVKYLRATLSGSSTVRGEGCGGYGSCTDTHSVGSDVWSEETGLLSGGCTVYSVCDDGRTADSVCHYSGSCSSQCEWDTFATRTTCRFVGTDVCCRIGRHDGGWTWTLSDPASEEKALYRATNGLKWSDWAVLPSLPGCSALWELRSGIKDYDFAVREAEYQLEFPALTITEQATDPITGEPLWQSPGVPLTTTRQLTAQVEVRVDILRRPWNGGLWALYKTETFGPMTITGTQTLEGVVPNDRGYETAINNVRYRVVG